MRWERTGVRFWKDLINTGTHTAHLWSSTKQLLASATFANETATGWQEVLFPQPGGPSGPLEVLFANVRIPGGVMGIISSRVPGSVLRVLKRLRHTQVTVTSKLSHSGSRSASRVLRVS